jgi:hypothetical protein
VGRASAHRVGLSGRGDGHPPDAGNRGNHQRALDDSSRSRRNKLHFRSETMHSFLHSSIQRRPPPGGAVVQRTEDSVLRATAFKRSSFSPVPACVPPWDNTTRPRKAGLGLYHRRPAEAVGLGAGSSARLQVQALQPRVPDQRAKSEASGYAGNRQAPAVINHRSSDRHLTQNPAISHPKSFWILFLLLVPESSMQVLGREWRSEPTSKIKTIKITERCAGGMELAKMTSQHPSSEPHCFRNATSCHL